MNEERIKKELVDVMRRLYEKGLISSKSGNASCRIPGSSEIIITPSGGFKWRLSEDELVKIDFNGSKVWGYREPSSEWRTHLMIYKKRMDVNAVVHAHNPITIALTLSGVELSPLTDEARLTLGDIKVVPHAPPGTEELARLVAKSLENKKTNVLILEKHGVLGLGRDLADAVNVVEVLEDVARMTLIRALIRSMD